jgi:hypothetical protein
LPDTNKTVIQIGQLDIAYRHTLLSTDAGDNIRPVSGQRLEREPSLET